jgi:Ca2+-transporting ATPase
VLTAYLWTIWWHGPGARATTVAFVSVVLVHPFQAMNCRSERYGWWRLPPNRLVGLSLVTLAAAQWVAVSWAPLAGVLHTAPLPAADWLLIGAAVVWPVVLMEVAKAWRHEEPALVTAPLRGTSP